MVINIACEKSNPIGLYLWILWCEILRAWSAFI